MVRTISAEGWRKKKSPANYADAKQRLERVEEDIMGNFKVMGVRAESVDGYDRLKIM